MIKNLTFLAAAIVIIIACRNGSAVLFNVGAVLGVVSIILNYKQYGWV